MRTTQIILSDDLDPEITADITTINFALDGVSYEIDLGSANEKKLREAFAPYVSAGRKTVGKRRTSAGAGDAKQARIWLKDNGYEVGDRGRLTAEQMDIYLKNK